MKIKVIRAFIDKNTGEPYNRGDIFESTDKARIKELRAAGYLAGVAEISKPAVDETNESKTAATE